MAEKTIFTIDEQHKLKDILHVIEDLAESVKQSEVNKASHCISKEDIQRIVDLGLGRGVDATNSTPWKNKTFFQVRPVTFENIIGTEEGGCVQSYEREVLSAVETRGRASATVTDPKSSVTIGVEAEYAQSSSDRYKVVGAKVLNRTISFKDHCDDADIQPHLESESFEIQLCKWILKKAGVGPDVATKRPQADIEEEQSYIQNKIQMLEEQMQKRQSIIDETNENIKLFKTEIQKIEQYLEEVQKERQLLEQQLHEIMDCLSQQDVKEDPDRCKRFEEGRTSIMNELETTFQTIGKLTSRRNELRETELIALIKRVDKLQEEQESDTVDHKQYIVRLKLLVKDSEQSLIKLFKQFASQDENEQKRIYYCTKFITQFRITHYVSSIQLGASGYEVLTQNTLTRTLGIGGRVGVEKIAAGSVSTTHSRSHHHKSSNIRRIGVIELKDNIPTVTRGSHQEAVVGIQVKPVSNLVTMRELRAPLKKALLKYLRSEGEVFAGPFYIHCATSGDMQLYWKVDESYRVTATSKENNPSKFYIKPSGDPKHRDEFYICHYDRNPHEVNAEIKDNKYAEPIPRYLQTPINVSGFNPGPLQFGYYVRTKDTRLVLTSNVRGQNQLPVSLSAWMNGREICFIQCARRRWRRGFIAVVKQENGYHTCCVHSKHNEYESTSFMLFQLIQTPETKAKKPPSNLGEDDVDIRGMSQQSAFRTTTDEQLQQILQKSGPASSLAPITEEKSSLQHDDPLPKSLPVISKAEGAKQVPTEPKTSTIK